MGNSVPLLCLTVKGGSRCHCIVTISSGPPTRSTIVAEILSGATAGTVINTNASREAAAMERLLPHYRFSHRSISSSLGGWPVRRMPMRKTLPAIHSAPAAERTSSTNVPTRSISGGSAMARFIMMNGV
jgi:hypothetical protein